MGDKVWEAIVLTNENLCATMELPRKRAAALISNKSVAPCKEKAILYTAIGKTEDENLKGKRIKYTKDMPRRLYSFFVTYKETIGAPSFSKFARSIGATTAEIEKMRSNSEFERAYRECNEIRRDYLIDNALCKKFDGSVTKFLLGAEFGMGESKETDADSALDLTLTVLSEGEN